MSKRYLFISLFVLLLVLLAPVATFFVTGGGFQAVAEGVSNLTGSYLWAGAYLWAGSYLWAGAYLWAGSYLWAG